MNMHSKRPGISAFCLLCLLTVISGHRSYGQSDSDSPILLEAQKAISTTTGSTPPTTQPKSDRLKLWPQRRAVRSSTSSLDPLQVSRRALSCTRYPLTPGDCYELLILMGTAATYTLVLPEGYDLAVPYIGTINVQGKSFIELRNIVLGRLKKTLPLAQFLGFALSSPAQFDVPVFGEVENPGIFPVSPLCRVSDVVAMAGGVREFGSIRTIALQRGKQRTLIDLFHYCTEGESGANPYVEPGDSILVPKIEISVVLGGEVNYPGYYELVTGDTLCDLLCYAGGPRVGTASRTVDVVRYESDGSYRELSLNFEKEPNAVLKNGDRIRVVRTVENLGERQ